jgi:hypothetical protein
MIDANSSVTLAVLIFWFMAIVYYWHWYKRSLKK